MKLDRIKIIGILGIVLVIQCVILVFLYAFSFQGRKIRKMDKPLIASFNKDSILSFDISDSMDTFSVLRKEGSWYVETEGALLPADFSKVQEYLTILESLNQGIVVYEGIDPESELSYGFDKVNYQKVDVHTTNKSDFTIYVGNPGKKRGTSYIRINDEKKVREVDSFISIETSNMAVQWAKKKIFENLAVEDIEMCKIDADLPWFKGQYTISYDVADETGKDPFVINPPLEKEVQDYALENAIENIINVTIEDYMINGTVDSLETVATVTLKIRKNGKEYQLSVLKNSPDDPEGYDYVLDVDFNGYYYYCDEDLMKKIIKNTDDLVK